MHHEISGLLDTAPSERRFLEMVARGVLLPSVLDELCRLAEDLLKESWCGVVLVDPDGARLERAAAPSLPESFLMAINGRPLHRYSGPNAMAAHLGEPVVAADLASDARWWESGWRAMALSHGVHACCAMPIRATNGAGVGATLKNQVIVEDIETDQEWRGSSYCDHVLAHGLRAVWSTPIQSQEGRVLGTFCLYQRKPGAPSLRQQELIAQVTHIASIALERVRAEAALRRSEAFLAEGQRLSLIGTFSWRVATDEIKWSEQAYRIFGVDPGTPVTIGLVFGRIHPEDAPGFMARTERARRETDDLEFECR